MDIPHGFDCYAFQKEEIKYFEPDLYKVKHSVEPNKLDKVAPSQMDDKLNAAAAAAAAAAAKSAINSSKREQQQPPQQQPPPELAATTPSTTFGQADFIKFTRKNEDYPREQLQAFGKADRLNMSEIDKRIFCGIKIQIGIGVVTNFLHKGMQYKAPIKGRSELINGSWTGIMRGLTIDSKAPTSYDLALGNFLAWDEEFPHIKFGPFFAVESKLVVLTGSSRRIETSSFGTNMTLQIWITILTLMLVLSLLSSLRIYCRTSNRKRATLAHPADQDQDNGGGGDVCDRSIKRDCAQDDVNIVHMFQEFFFIYFTMLLNKPSVEFDDLVWPKRHHYHQQQQQQQEEYGQDSHKNRSEKSGQNVGMDSSLHGLPTSIRALGYMWSAACLVIASIYSGEMLAVMLLHADQNIDTIAQLISAKPRIEPVIRQDDMTYNLMLKSMDVNMLKLYNITRIIPRAEVYTRSFIESVSERKVALLGDDELIETIYDLYHKYYPLYKSKMTYLQFPISIIYRKDLNATLENQLRRGMLQLFEMGLIHRWYQAQKDTYIKFYDTYERNKTTTTTTTTTATDKGVQKSDADGAGGSSEQKYKPLSMQHFSSFFRSMLYCKLFAILVLLLELVHYKLAGAATKKRSAKQPKQQQQQREQLRSVLN